MKCNSEFFNFIPIDLGLSGQLLGTNLQQHLLKLVGYHVRFEKHWKDVL